MNTKYRIVAITLMAMKATPFGSVPASKACNDASGLKALYITRERIEAVKQTDTIHTDVRIGDIRVMMDKMIENRRQSTLVVKKTAIVKHIKPAIGFHSAILRKK